MLMITLPVRHAQCFADAAACRHADADAFRLFFIFTPAVDFAAF